MITYTTARHINRSAEFAFDLIGTHLYENHPKWEKEVVEIRRITPDPVSVGSRAIMVRREFGQTTESEYEITEFEPGRRIAAFHPDDSMDFRIGFEITSIDNDSCTIQVDVEAQPKGWTRVFEPVMRVVMPKRGDRIMSSMADFIEKEPART